MLKMDLRPGESIRVGDAIITLEDKSGRVARIAFRADKDVPIRRVTQGRAAKVAAEAGLTGAPRRALVAD